MRQSGLLESIVGWEKFLCEVIICFILCLETLCKTCDTVQLVFVFITAAPYFLSPAATINFYVNFIFMLLMIMILLSFNSL